MVYLKKTLEPFRRPKLLKSASGKKTISNYNCCRVAIVKCSWWGVGGASGGCDVVVVLLWWLQGIGGGGGVVVVVVAVVTAFIGVAVIIVVKGYISLYAVLLRWW